MTEMINAEHHKSVASHVATEDIKFGYCTEFIINLEKEYTEKDEHEFKAYLESLGDSIVVVSDDDVVKVHVHTNDPGLAIQKALTYGSLSRMKIDNMREEHHERLIQNAEKLAKEQKDQEEREKAEQAKASEEPRKPAGFIAVSVGEGLSEIFRGIGADYIIEGGQTMNPSTEDMLSAIEKVNADVIYILPNNKNIILAAEQAKYLVEDKKIVVVPSRTVPQGITALINFVPDQTPEENLETMKDEMARVKTGQITYAVRNTNIDGMEIHEGDKIKFGNTEVEFHEAPGHTEGVISCFFDVTDGKETKRVGYYGGFGFNTLQKSFLLEIGDTNYSMRETYLRPIEKVINEKVDIFMPNHCVNVDLLNKRQFMIDHPSEPNPFIDENAWKNYLQMKYDDLKKLMADPAQN